MSLSVRGAWVVRSSITSADAIARLLDIAAAHELNTLIVQVRGRGDASYRGGLEPLAESLQEAPPTFDPLETMLTRAKGHGIRVHAWLNAHYAWEGADPPRDPQHLVNLHPDWLMRSRAGDLVKGGGEVEGLYTCPSNLAARAHLSAVYLDVTRRYPVAGIHLDYIRYPSRDYCYCESCSFRFREFLRWWDPEADTVSDEELKSSRFLEMTERRPKEWDQFRRTQISDLVRQVYQNVKEAKEDCVVSAAVFASARDAYDNRLQDWKSWLASDALDVACPMAYTTDSDQFETQIRDAVGATRGARPVWAGIGAYRMDAAATAEKIARAEAAGADGILLFSLGAVTQEGDSDDYLRSLNLRSPAPKKPSM